jgi:hypothetical protein
LRVTTQQDGCDWESAQVAVARFRGITYHLAVRWLTVLFVLALPVVVAAKPKVAVAPIEGDSTTNGVGKIVAEAADDHAKVIGPAKTGEAMESLGITTLNGKALKKLRVKLEVELIVHGKIEKDGKKLHLSLTIQGKGKNKTDIDLMFKDNKALKKDLSKKLEKRFDSLLGGEEDPDDEDAPPKKHEDDPPKKHEDDPPKHADDDHPKKHDDDHPKKRVAEDDSVRKHRGDDDEDDTKHRKHRKHHDERNPITQEAAWVDGGAELARRTLTWDGTGADLVPHVGTAAAAAYVDGEIYPAAFDKLGGAAAFGLYGDVSHTLGLSITIPGMSASVPIRDGHYQIGARYRFTFGSSSLAVGASYWRRYYLADLSAPMAAMLDMPGVNYTAVAPGALLRFAATPTIGGFAEVAVPLVLASGQIQSAKSYGRGTVIAFDVKAGAQIVLGPHYALALAASFDQVGIKYQAGANSLAATRGISHSTDRTVGVTASIGILY